MLVWWTARLLGSCGILHSAMHATLLFHAVVGLPRVDLDPRMHITAFRTKANEILQRIQVIIFE